MTGDLWYPRNPGILYTHSSIPGWSVKGGSGIPVKGGSWNSILGILGYSDTHSSIPGWSLKEGGSWNSILGILGYSDIHSSIPGWLVKRMV